MFYLILQIQKRRPKDLLQSNVTVVEQPLLRWQRIMVQQEKRDVLPAKQ